MAVNAKNISKIVTVFTSQCRWPSYICIAQW